MCIVLKAFHFSTFQHFLSLVWAPPFLWILWLLLQVLWWIIFVIGTCPIWQMVPWYFLPYRLVQRMANLCPHHCLPYAPSGLRSGQTPFCSNRCTLLAKAWPVWGYVSPTCISANHIHRPSERCPGNTLCAIDWQRTSWDRLLLALSGIVRFGSAQTLQMSEHGFGRITEARRDFWFPPLFCYRDQVGNR